MRRSACLLVGPLLVGAVACSGGQPARDAAGTVGLFRVQADLSSRPGIEDVQADAKGDVTSFVLDFSEADGKKVPLAQAQKQTLAYLPSGSAYGSSITQDYCRTYTMTDTGATADVSFYTADPTNPTPLKFDSDQIAVAVVVNRDVTNSVC